MKALEQKTFNWKHFQCKSASFTKAVHGWKESSPTFLDISRSMFLSLIKHPLQISERTACKVASCRSCYPAPYCTYQRSPEGRQHGCIQVFCQESIFLYCWCCWLLHVCYLSDVVPVFYVYVGLVPSNTIVIVSGESL